MTVVIKTENPEGLARAAMFVASLVREGVRFEADLDAEGAKLTIVFTGGF
jgi:hypothetical protein